METLPKTSEKVRPGAPGRTGLDRERVAVRSAGRSDTLSRLARPEPRVPGQARECGRGWQIASQCGLESQSERPETRAHGRLLQ